MAIFGSRMTTAALRGTIGSASAIGKRELGLRISAGAGVMIGGGNVRVEGRRWKSGPYGYTQAKALVYSKNGEPKDVLSLHTHSISPSLPPSTLLLKTLAAPINPADINQIQGTYPSQPPFTSLLGTASPSAVGGNEGCFEILSSPPKNDQNLQKGDWVIMSHTNFGTWRTHALASPSDVLKITNREHLTPIQVGTVGVNPCTAYRMLKDFETLYEGDWFIQNGANSGVGRAAIQFGRMWNYKSINIIRDRPSPQDTEALKQELLDLGATHVVTESELQDRSFGQKVKEWTRGGREQIKLGLNCVGGKPTSALIKTLSNAGHLVTYGGMAKAPLLLNTGALIFKDLKFSGFWVSRWSDRNPVEKKRTVDEVLEMTRMGLFKDVPVEEVNWNWETEGEVLVKAVEGTLEGFRKGKGVFVFGET